MGYHKIAKKMSNIIDDDYSFLNSSNDCAITKKRKYENMICAEKSPLIHAAEPVASLELPLSITFYAQALANTNTEDSVYVLKLENEKFYVGFSRNVSQRIITHINGTSGVQWVQDNKPLSIIDVYKGTPLMEQSRTEELMCEFGIANVRGGALTAQELPAEHVSYLNKKFESWHEACFSCGQKGHYSRNCSTKSAPPRAAAPQLQTHIPMSDIGVSLWSSLDSPYRDTVSKHDDGTLTVIYSGQRSGGNDHLIIKGAAFFYRETNKQEWVLSGTVESVVEIKTGNAGNGVRRYTLTIIPHEVVENKSVPLQAHGKRSACKALGLRLPCVDGWEKSGIIKH